MFGATRNRLREVGQPSGSLREPYDVAVLGEGPAGLLLARELAGHGLDVICVSPRLRRGLPASYGLWLDEAKAGGIGDCLEAVWPTATVRISDARAHVLARPYARVDPERMHEKLRAQCLARDVRFLEDAATHLAHDDDGTTVMLETGGVLRALLVVDATGHSSPFVEKPHDPRPATQMAYGLLLEDARLPEGETALIMDLRPAIPGEGESQPSFLYALGRPDGHALVEETSLVATPPVSERVLERRLRARMARMGLRGREVGDEISCIPLGRPLPFLDQRVLGFGAAGGMVHPATGYMLAGVLSRAAPVAAAVAEAVRVGAPVKDLAPLGWQALWPEERRIARTLHVFGMEVMRELDGEGLRTFFDAYFTAAGEEWPALLSFDARASDITALMERVFRDFPLALKMRASLLLTRRYRGLLPHLTRSLLGAPPRGAHPH